MKNKTCFMCLFLVFSLLCSSGGFAQELMTISGKVIDDSNQEPISGVSVVVRGELRGATTNVRGEYSIKAKPGQTLEFTFLGMDPATARVGASDVIHVAMRSSSIQMDEIVTIGYGTIRKSDLTGSVSSVKSEDLNRTAISSLEQGLQGRIAGVEVVQGDAAPGGAAYIQIRGVSTMTGSAEPLYVIDGAPFEVENNMGTTSTAGYTTTNPLSTLSPSDIESIEILKDASATAIYGSRGANGVVLITTKRGNEGRAQISFTTNQSVSIISRKIQVLNARQYAEYKNEAGYNNNPTRQPEDWDYPITPVGNKKISPAALEELVGDGIDWQDEIYRPAYVQDYQLSISGGSATNKYSIMMGYLDQQGILMNTSFNRLSTRVNTDTKFNNWMQMVFSASYTNSINHMVKTSSNDGSSKAGGVVRKALTYSPIPPFVKDADGNIIGVSSGSPEDYDTEDPNYENNWGATPLRFLNEATIDQILNNFTGNVEFRINLAKDLQIKTRLAGVYYDQGNDNYFPRTLNEGKAVDGLAQVGTLNFHSYLTENLLTYKYKINNHRLDFLGGFTWEEKKNRSHNMEASGYADDILDFWAMENALIVRPIRLTATASSLASFLARVNYNYMDRYLATYTFRTDGSSKFAADNKWAMFHSIAFAWRANQEDFLKHIRWLDNLKLRLSYGESGNQGLSSYQSLSIVSGTITTIGNQQGNGYYETSQANPSLRWETTAQLNLGVDFGFFNGRISGSVNVYQKDTRDLLQSISLAPSTGFYSKTLNSGEIRNKGIEIDLYLRPLEIHNFSWDTNLNWYTNKNEVRNLGGIDKQFASTLGSAYGLNMQPFIQTVGQPIGALYGYVFDGVFQNQAEVDSNFAYDKDGNWGKIQTDQAVGMLKFKDINGDGRIDSEDQTIIGDTNPEFFFGFNNTFSYKRLSLGVFVSGVVGGDIINTNFIMPMKLNGESNIPAFLYDEAWRGDGTSNKARLIKSGNEEPKKFSRQYVEKRTYVRIRNINLSYRFDMKKIRQISALTVSLNAINPFTFTKYRGYDPEVSATSNILSRGVDMGNYPLAKTFSFGLNVIF